MLAPCRFDSGSRHFINIPALIGLLGAIFSGAAYTLIRAMSEKEPANKIVFHFSMVSLLATTPLLLFQFENPDLMEMIGLIGTGIFATIGQIALTKSYHYTKATEVALYKYAHIIFAVITGYIFFKEMPDILSFMGGVIIIIAAVYQRNKMLKSRGIKK
ncbi:MAG: DMT family transporter [Candidatus Zixiibacteriota bacterium]